MTLLSQFVDRVASLAAHGRDTARHLRYQQAAFRRLAAARTGSDASPPSHATQWMPMAMRGRSHAALVCHPPTQISYDVTLPHDAAIVSWLAVAANVPNQGDAAVEFRIQVAVGGMETSARLVIVPERRGRWHRLRVAAPAAGPARIALSATVAAPAPPSTGETQALWGDPGIELPRSAASLLAAVRSRLASWGWRGVWRLSASGDNLYAIWIRESRPSRRALLAQQEWARAQARTLSFITFVAESSDWPGEATANSLSRQTYPHWEWCLAATAAAIEQRRDDVARLTRDRRVRVISVPSSATRADAWNAAWRAATGEFAAVIDAGDRLPPEALYEVASAIESDPRVDLLYSDEDRIPPGGGSRHDPHFKPDWSPELLLAHNYIGRLTMIRTSVAAEAGGFRAEYSPAEEWDLLLRLSRQTPRFHRVARCLYHRADHRVAPAQLGQDCRERAALEDHCRRLGRVATVSHSPGGYRVSWPIAEAPLVSIVIPNRNAAEVITQCVNGILHGTSYPRREIVVVDNGSTDPAVLTLYRSLEHDGTGVVVPFDRPFNFSAACNAGAAAGRGELLLFLNNDIEIIDADWLDELVRWASLPEVGIVGAKLLYPDRTIQHAGVVFGLGLVGHIFSRAPEGAAGLFGSSDSYRNYLGVTGACQMMRRDVFARLGGFDERLRLSFSDITLCMEAWKAGYRVVYTPYARLIHHESYTRKREDWPEDLEGLARYLEANGFVDDPYFHPQLNPQSPSPALRPPFAPTPRQAVRDYVERVLRNAAMAGR